VPSIDPAVPAVPASTVGQEPGPLFDLHGARAALLERFPTVDDHPDVAGLLRDPVALALLGPALAAPFADSGVTAVVAPDARGPILGALTALSLGVGLVLVRKDPANHPGADVKLRSAPTWRGTPVAFQGRSFDLSPADRVLMVDDWITTGSSMRTSIEIVRRIGATVAGVAVLVDKADPGTIVELGVHALVPFAAIGLSGSATTTVTREAGASRPGPKGQEEQT